MGMVRDGAQVTGVVLAGGASRRFGADKTRAELAGRPVLAHTLDAIGQLVGSHSGVAPGIGEVLVLGPWAPDGVRSIQESTPGRGPAAALAFGLQLLDTRWVLLVGGDQPLVQPSLLSMLVERTESVDADAVVPVRDGRDEPLVACYRRSVGRVAEELSSAGRTSFTALLAAIRVDRVAEQEWRHFDPDGRSFLDVDTPHDLEVVRQLRGSEGRGPADV